MDDGAVERAFDSTAALTGSIPFHIDGNGSPVNMMKTNTAPSDKSGKPFFSQFPKFSCFLAPIEPEQEHDGYNQ